jgi:type I restriction enzyme S subunit
MVASASALKHPYRQKAIPIVRYAELPQEDVKWCTVSLADILTANKRLEAAFFDVDAKHAREVITNCKWESVPLPQILNSAYYPGRFKRIYSDAPKGVPFYLPSQMTDVYPKPEKYISALTKCDISELRLKYGDVLLTRSGTIGSVTIVSKSLENTVFSDDVIRITPNGDLSGFVYAYLRSKTGNTILKTNRYGSVIQHIEPGHLAEIPIPNPPDIIKAQINDLIMRSYALRDESNELIDKATSLLIDALNLPPIHALTTSRFDISTDVNNYNVKLSELSGRLDGSYHVPIVAAIKEHLHKYAAEVTTVGDKRVCQNIILPGRFKRVYVEEGQGQVFFSGKDIMELDPSDKKYLSFSQHNKRIKEQLTIHHNMILVTCSGTVGKIAIVPKHWDNWAMTHDIIRLVPQTGIEGYLFIWLQSPYAYNLIEAQTYGSVVPHIEISHIKQIPVPVLKNTGVQTEINRLALDSNKLRYKAYQLEQEAMRIMDDEVLFATALPTGMEYNALPSFVAEPAPEQPYE